MTEIPIWRSSTNLNSESNLSPPPVAFEITVWFMDLLVNIQCIKLIRGVEGIGGTLPLQLLISLIYMR